MAFEARTCPVDSWSCQKFGPTLNPLSAAFIVTTSVKICWLQQLKWWNGGSISNRSWTSRRHVYFVHLFVYVCLFVYVYILKCWIKVMSNAPGISQLRSARIVDMTQLPWDAHQESFATFCDMYCATTTLGYRSSLNTFKRKFKMHLVGQQRGRICMSIFHSLAAVA